MDMHWTCDNMRHARYINSVDMDLKRSDQWACDPINCLQQDFDPAPSTVQQQSLLHHGCPVSNHWNSSLLFSFSLRLLLLWASIAVGRLMTLLWYFSDSFSNISPEMKFCTLFVVLQVFPFTSARLPDPPLSTLEPPPPARWFPQILDHENIRYKLVFQNLLYLWAPFPTIN